MKYAVLLLLVVLSIFLVACNDQNEVGKAPALPETPAPPGPLEPVESDSNLVGDAVDEIDYDYGG